MAIQKVISGGQTGGDQGGWRAAKVVVIATGGWMPKGFLTEDGPRPEFAEMYGAKEHASAQYPPRTYANVHDSDATVWFGRGDSRGFACTSKATERIGRPFLTILTRRPLSETVLWMRGFGVKVLNVAGNRESSSPGIGARVEEYLIEMFRLLATDE